jgi:DNA-binding CsgD family transcriptional regulator
MTAMISDSPPRTATDLALPAYQVPRDHRVWVMAAFLLGVIVRDAADAGPVFMTGDWPADPDSPRSARRPQGLTHGEARVLHYLPSNLSAREIAGELYLSVNTVKTHQRHLYQKLGARSRTQAVRQARALGLLAPPAGGKGLHRPA